MIPKTLLFFNIGSHGANRSHFSSHPFLLLTPSHFYIADTNSPSATYFLQRSDYNIIGPTYNLKDFNNSLHRCIKISSSALTLSLQWTLPCLLILSVNPSLFIFQIPPRSTSPYRIWTSSSPIMSRSASTMRLSLGRLSFFS